MNTSGLVIKRHAPRCEPLTEVHNPVLRRVYQHRGVADADAIDLSLQGLHPPQTLSDIDIAAQRLATAIMGGEHILVVGDFDADGATSVALCMSVFQAFGATDVSYLVPNRFEFGYGLSPEIVDLAATRAPRVIMTVDNGVSSVAGVAKATELGIDVIVTDHHLPGAELPAATAMVNPNMPGCTFPSKALAGVGVAYYVLSVVRRHLVTANWFSGEVPNLGQHLDLVALGTVADVVPLDANNRRLVYQGLRRMRAGACRPGIKALAEVGKRQLATLTAQDLGFALGPRLNAAGRLEDMALGIKCLLAEDLTEARRLATALDQLNRTRRELEQDMVGDAEFLVAADQAADHRLGLAIYHETFHQGVVGIVAGRIREKFNKPTIVFADAGDVAPDELKGSARSVEGLHIRDALDRIATRQPGLLLKFGGHAMAAGLAIKRVHFERFVAVWDKVVGEIVAEAQTDLLQAVLYSDGQLSAGDLALDTAFALREGGPWGAEFTEPLFDGEFELVSQRVVGEIHLKLVLKLDGRLIDGIAFRQAPLTAVTEAAGAGAGDATSSSDRPPARVHAAYRLGINDYGQVQTPQLVVEYLQPIP